MARILITGATGHIGRQLSDHLEASGHEVVRFGTRAETPGVIAADLSVWQESWASVFHGVDQVIHLAACPRPDANWVEIQTLNLDLTNNVYEAAARAGVRRLIFASSNWVVAGHRFDDARLDSEVTPSPVNAYGASKLAGERLGRLYSQARGMSVICLRIGFNQQRPGNQPGEHMSSGLWGQQMWLSDRDLCAGFACAIDAPDTLDFAVLNLVSNNAGMRWDLDEAQRLIGFAPQDASTPIASDAILERETSARELRESITRLEALLAESRL